MRGAWKRATGWLLLAGVALFVGAAASQALSAASCCCPALERAAAPCGEALDEASCCHVASALPSPARPNGDARPLLAVAPPPAVWAAPEARALRAPRAVAPPDTALLRTTVLRL